jgi:hypothetical protein
MAAASLEMSFHGGVDLRCLIVVVSSRADGRRFVLQSRAVVVGVDLVTTQFLVRAGIK